MSCFKIIALGFLEFLACSLAYSSNEVDFVGLLPEEITLDILEYVPPKYPSQVSKQWKFFTDKIRHDHKPHLKYWEKGEEKFRLLTEAGFKHAKHLKVNVERHTVKGVNFDFAEIPGGIYTMGSPLSERERYSNEVIRENVEVGPLKVLITPVTEGQYKIITGENPLLIDKYGVVGHLLEMCTWAAWGFSRDYYRYCPHANYPVTAVSYFNAAKFAEKLGYQLGLPIDLLTEEEWEWAARAETTTSYPFDISEFDNHVWNWENSGKMLHPVGQKVPNGWLYDMHGPVREWTKSKWDPADDEDSDRVVRNQAWYTSYEQDFRSAIRRPNPLSNMDSGLGFRVAIREP